MKVLLLTVGLLLVLALPIVPSISDERLDWKMQVDLDDGSRVIGIPANKELQVNMGFADLSIPLERIRRAEWQRDRKTVRIEMANHDMLSGQVLSRPIRMKTQFGDVTLSMNHFQSLEILPADPYGWLPTNKGLIAYYSFDRQETDQASNLASEQHAGSIQGAQWTELGRRGGAMQFDGSSRITIPHASGLCPDLITVAAWVYPTGNRGGYAMILGKSQAGSWSGGYAMVYISGDEKHVHFYVNGYTDSVVKAEVPNDQWSHLVGVCDGETVKMYLNGKIVETAAVRHRVPVNRGKPGYGVPVIVHTDRPLTLGSDESGYHWKGKLDEVALYDRPLKPQEVRRLYETGAMFPVYDE